MGNHRLHRGSVRNYWDYLIDPKNTWFVMMKMKGQDVLNVIAFLFTVLIVLYGLNKGFDGLGLSLQVIYFTVLILSQLGNLKIAIKR